MRAYGLFVAVIVGSSVMGLGVACTSSNNGGSSSGTSGDVADGAASSSGGEGGSSSGTVDAAGAKGGGSIQLTSTSTSSTFAAAFADATAVALPSCTRTTIGSCVVNECPIQPLPEGGTARLLSAGAITVTGGVIPAPGITVEPDANGSYAKQGVGALWAGGETFSFVAAGAAVPGFTQTVNAPSPIDIATPTLPAPPTGIDVPRATDFTITWATGATSVGKVGITMGSASTSTNNSIVCTFDVAAKTGTVPSAALAKMVGAQGSLLIGVSSDSQQLQKDYLVTTTLSMPGRANGVDLTVDFVNFK
ncbi:MAG: hypothetical protein JST00_34975 [Deltaproteobacteria bacterium]|nr:hypothetical protein [Deltaproteobacteria bacterium]